MVAAIATCLIALAILVKGTTTGGQIGMALNIVLVANTTLVGLVTSWTNMEISLGAMYVVPPSSLSFILILLQSPLFLSIFFFVWHASFVWYMGVLTRITCFSQLAKGMYLLHMC